MTRKRYISLAALVPALVLTVVLLGAGSAVGADLDRFDGDARANEWGHDLELGPPDRPLVELEDRAHRVRTEAEELLDEVAGPPTAADDVAPPSPLPPPTTAAADEGPASCAPHPPIVVTEDEGPQGFVLDRDPVTGQPIYRPGSGVVAGNGTAEDPYVIDDWCISAPVGILLQNTTAHVVVRDNTVEGGSLPGVWLNQTRNVTIEDNTVTGSEYGVVLEDANGSLVRDNRVSHTSPWDVLVIDSDDVRFRSNVVGFEGGPFRPSDYGIGVARSDGVEIVDNAVESQVVGLVVADSEQARIEENDLGRSAFYGGVLASLTNAAVHNNTVTDSPFGLVGLDVTEGRVEENTFRDNEAVGAFLIGSQRLNVTGNRVTDNGFLGVWSLGLDRSRVLDNEFARHPGASLLVSVSNGTLVSGNVIGDTPEVGVFAAGSTNLSVRDNVLGAGGLWFWGASLDHYQHTVDASNTVNGEPVRYVDGETDTEVPGPAGQVLLVNTTSVEVSGLDLPDASSGVLAAFTRDTELTGNAFENNPLGGITLARSSNATLQANALGDGGLNIQGDRLADYRHEVDETNTVNGDPLRYVEDGVDVQVDRPAGQVFLVNTTGALVEGMDLSAASTAAELAFTRDSTLRDNTIRNARTGVAVFEANGTTLTHMDVSEIYVGVDVYRSSEVQIRQGTLVENDGHGVEIRDTPGARVVDSTLGTTGAFWSSGARLDNATGARIQGTNVTDAFYGVQVLDSAATTIENNVLEANQTGADVRSSPGASVTNNVLQNNGFRGLSLASSDETLVEHNTVSGNGQEGIGVAASTGTSVVDNVVANNEQGIDVGGSNEVRIEGNNIRGNEDFGLVVAGGNDPVDARDNWWGHASGPSGQRIDACTRSVSAGLGDSILTFNGEVCFDPWRTSPNPDAGRTK